MARTEREPAGRSIGRREVLKGLGVVGGIVFLDACGDNKPAKKISSGTGLGNQYEEPSFQREASPQADNGESLLAKLTKLFQDADTTAQRPGKIVRQVQGYEEAQKTNTEAPATGDTIGKKLEKKLAEHQKVIDGK